MVLAKKGKYFLQHKIFLGRNKRTTFSIEICKELEDKSKIAICTLNQGEINLISCENRLISTIENMDDLQDVKLLIDILYLIYSTEEFEIKE